jgi:hypothetical protein
VPRRPHSLTLIQFIMDAESRKEVTDQAPGPAGSPVVRCILWHPRSSVLHHALIAALDRPAIQWKAWDSDLLALAELFRPSTAADDLTLQARAKVLLLVEPTRLPGLLAVLDALERFRPDSLLWVFEGGDSPKLSSMSLLDVRRRFGSAAASVAPPTKPAAPAVSPSFQIVTRVLGPIVPKPVAPAAKPAATKSAAPRPASPPPLRLAGEGTLPSLPSDDPEPLSAAPRGDSPPPPDRAASTLLSEEEIEMLLADPPPKGPKRDRNVR